jgi:alkanesulfonate monooxygenase SsuD/methylene tetrahydromethanopterin reductase-like flavin-dependent oxidoreductase (luciferase family)
VLINGLDLALPDCRSPSHTISPRRTPAAVDVCLGAFRPSEALPEPYVMLGVAAICGETAERAEWLAGPSGCRSPASAPDGEGGRRHPEQAAAHEFTPRELEIIRSWTSSSIVGDP